MKLDLKKKINFYMVFVFILIYDPFKTIVHAIDFVLLNNGKGSINYENTLNYGLQNNLRISYGDIGNNSNQTENSINIDIFGKVKLFLK